MNLKLITAATEEPITLDEAKLSLRVTETDDDSIVSAGIIAARDYVETFTGRALCSQTWELTLEEFDEEMISLPMPPLVSVTSVKYYDSTNTQQTLSATYYTVVTSDTPGYIQLNSGYSWPTTYDRHDAIAIRYVCGYGTAAAVPQSIKSALLVVTADLYETRQSSEMTPGSRTNDVADMLLWPYRVVSF